MKLSMWMLDDWLKAHGIKTTPSITSGQICLKGARTLKQEHEDSGFVNIYYTNPKDDEGPDETILSNNCDSIFISDYGREYIFNLVNGAFEYYNKWEMEMIMCLVHKKQIQELLDIAHQVFKRPMFIKSISSWVYAITKNYESDTHPYWAEMEESVINRSSGFDTVKAVSLDKDFQAVFLQNYPAVVESPSYKGFVLHSNVWVDNKRTCEIVALENSLSFTESDIQLMHVFTEIVELFIKTNDLSYVSSSGLACFFIRLLDGNGIIKENLKSIYKHTRWSQKDEYIVFCIESKTKYDTPIVRVLQDKLQEQFSSGYVFNYGNRLTCVVNLTKAEKYDYVIKNKYDYAIKMMKELVPTDLFHWGVSYEFVGIEQFVEYYSQAVKVLLYAINLKKSSLTMYQIAYSCVTEHLYNIDELYSYTHPDLIKLLEYDKENGTNYLQTLFEYLLCGCNYTDTANKLGLHRNGLIYRISRIEEQISSSLDDYENKKLLLTCLLLFNNFKTD